MVLLERFLTDVAIVRNAMDLHEVLNASIPECFNVPRVNFSIAQLQLLYNESQETITNGADSITENPIDQSVEPGTMTFDAVSPKLLRNSAYMDDEQIKEYL